jgi:hypothetical protein
VSMIANYLRVPESVLVGLYDDPSTVAELLYERERERVVDVDKAWHAIHYTLTGSAWEASGALASVVLGGRPIGDEDLGYGPARALTAAEVAAAAAELAAIDDAEFRARFDVEALASADVYPPIWDEGDDALDYVAAYYGVVRDLFRDAAASGDAIVIFLN